MMWADAGIIRKGDALACAGSVLSAWQAATQPARDRDGVELTDLLTCARLVTEAALLREESRGAHFRKDFPGTREEWRRHLVLTRD
jgi:L-aspartate oxidase